MKAEKEKQYSVAVVATMSAGKSTLMNALMVEDLLPTSNLACTSTVFAIQDDDAAPKFMGRYISGGKVSEWEDVDRAKLSDWNMKKADRIELKGNLPVIVTGNNRIQMTFLDTPGPNNSTNLRHGEITSDLIAHHDFSCVVCVLNATTLSTDNEKELLVSLLEQKRKRQNFNIYFALNKIDKLDIEQSEYPAETIDKLRKFLIQLGFENPVVIPTSASLSMAIRNIFRTAVPVPDKDLNQLLPLVKKYRSDLPAFRCTLSRNKQQAIADQISLLWAQRKFYRTCLHDEKNFRRQWLAIRRMPEPEKRQILIGDTFFTTEFLGKVDLLCGTAFLEKSVELDMLQKLDLSPSTYALQKLIRAKNKARKIMKVNTNNNSTPK